MLFGIFSIIGTLGIVGMSLMLDRHLIYKNRYSVPLVLGLIMSILLGVAGKFRNLVILSPLEAIWISTIKFKNLKYIYA